MDMNKEKNILNDDTLNRVSGGYGGPEPLVCPNCEISDRSKFTLLSRGPETEKMKCNECGYEFYHVWD